MCPCRLTVVAAVSQERPEMGDDMLERLALDLRAPELDIPLDIGGGHGRKRATARQPARQEIGHGRPVLPDRGRVHSPGLGQMAEVALARHVQGASGFGSLQPPHGCQEAREDPLRAPIRLRASPECERGVQVRLAEGSPGLDSVTVLEGLIKPIQMQVRAWP